MYGPLNITDVTLIPKVELKSTVNDSTPISYCFVVYKIISKIFAVRLHNVVCSIVNETQSSFIRGRHIVDNDLLAADLIKGYNWAHISHRCMVKVYMAKAYDFVEWSFLENVLCELGFPKKCIGWIIGCVTSVFNFIPINYCPLKNFQGK